MKYGEWKRLRRKFKKAGFTTDTDQAHDQEGKPVTLVLRFSLDKKEADRVGK